MLSYGSSCGKDVGCHRNTYYLPRIIFLCRVCQALFKTNTQEGLSTTDYSHPRKVSESGRHTWHECKKRPYHWAFFAPRDEIALVHAVTLPVQLRWGELQQKTGRFVVYRLGRIGCSNELAGLSHAYAPPQRV